MNGDLRDIRVKEMMNKKPSTIGIDEPFSRVWEIMSIQGIRHLPVLDDERILQGIITKTDLYGLISPRRTMEGNPVYDKTELDRYILKHVMNKDVYTLSPDDQLEKAIAVVGLREFGCLPVVDDKKYLVGIVTPIDMLRAIAKHLKRQ